MAQSDWCGPLISNWTLNRLIKLTDICLVWMWPCMTITCFIQCISIELIMATFNRSINLNDIHCLVSVRYHRFNSFYSLYHSIILYSLNLVINLVRYHRFNSFYSLYHSIILYSLNLVINLVIKWPGFKPHCHLNTFFFSISIKSSLNNWKNQRLF